MAARSMDAGEALRTLGLLAATADRESLRRAWRRFARGREAYETLSGLSATGAVVRGGAAARARQYQPPALRGREWTA